MDYRQEGDRIYEGDELVYDGVDSVNGPRIIGLLQDISDQAERIANLTQKCRLFELCESANAVLRNDTDALRDRAVKAERERDKLEKRLGDINLKDRGKTREINLLTAETRVLTAQLQEAGIQPDLARMKLELDKVRQFDKALQLKAEKALEPAQQRPTPPPADSGDGDEETNNE